MHRLTLLVVSILAVLSVTAFAQVAPLPPTNAPAIGPGGRVVNPGIFLDSYQINYLPSPLGGGTVTGFVDITNSGALGADPFGPNAGTTGRICVNVYTFTPDEEETECCSCLVTPNALVHLTAADLTGNPGNGVIPSGGIVVKLLATVPGATTAVPGTNGVGGTVAGPFNQSSCNAAYPFDTDNLAPGMRAWTVNATSTEKSEFSQVVLSPGEITKMTNLCLFISGNQSGAGVCKSCTLGGIGAQKK
jgi:hypothetical protein